MTKFAEDELNKFLDENPDYRISAMTYVNQGAFYLGLVVYFEKIDNTDKINTKSNYIAPTNKTYAISSTNQPSKGMITCPECKTTQPKRDKCWQCGYKF